MSSRWTRRSYVPRTPPDASARRARAVSRHDRAAARAPLSRQSPLSHACRLPGCHGIFDQARSIRASNLANLDAKKPRPKHVYLL